jgi:hypothetical protein
VIAPLNCRLSSIIFAVLVLCALDSVQVQKIKLISALPVLLSRISIATVQKAKAAPRRA